VFVDGAMDGNRGGNMDSANLFVQVPDTVSPATAWFLGAIAEPLPHYSGRWRIAPALVAAWAAADPDLGRLFATLEALAGLVVSPHIKWARSTPKTGRNPTLCGREIPR